MATARCYTKSGSVEKYESNLWSSPTAGNWSSLGVLGTITNPDSNGNYTVIPANNFEDSNTKTEFYCYTMYGSVRKTFYFKKPGYDILIYCHYYKKPNTQYTYVIACFLSPDVDKSIMDIFSLNVVINLDTQNQYLLLVSQNYGLAGHPNAYATEFSDPKVNPNQAPNLYFKENGSTKITKTYGSPVPIPYNFTLELA